MVIKPGSAPPHSFLRCEYGRFGFCFEPSSAEEVDLLKITVEAAIKTVLEVKYAQVTCDLGQIARYELGPNSPPSKTQFDDFQFV